MSALADLRFCAQSGASEVDARRRRAAGVDACPAEARGLDALEQAFATMIGERAQALTVLSDGVLFNCLLTRADEVIE